MKLIDKDRAIEEIEKEIKQIYAGREYVGIPSNEENMVRGLQKSEDIINSLEVKEVDLGKLLSDLDKDIKEFVATEEFERESITAGHYWVIAKHAFLLGLKAQKGK